MGLFSQLEENFKYFLCNSLITGRSFKNLSYLFSYPLSRQWAFPGIPLNILPVIESSMASTKVSVVDFQYFLRSGTLWHLLSSSIPNNKRNIALLISKLVSGSSVWFLSMTVQPGVANNHISKCIIKK